MGMLDAHPAVASYDELLLGGATGSGYWGRTDLKFFEPYFLRHRKHANRLARALWSFRYLNALYTSRQGTEAIGMKLMYEQLWHNPCVWLYMVRHRVRVVHLVRSNLLDIVLSEATAKARQRPHAWKGQTIETPAVTLVPNTLVSTLKTLEHRVKIARSLLTVLPISHVEISYEQLTAHPSLVYDIFAFLNVAIHSEPPVLVSRFRKLNTATKPDLIENYGEVAQALKGTRFESFLDE